MDVLDFLKTLTDPASIIQYGGLALLLVVVFAETGLFIGFFLPGDSLMFISGMICASRPELLGLKIWELLPAMMGAAILGNIVGYFFGKRTGPALFKRDDSWIFKKRYVAVTREFYDRHGGKTLVLGRFLPIIRTFAPILAGVIGVPFSRFMVYNGVGAVAWIGLLGGAGFVLGDYQWVQDNIEYIVIFLIVITLIPVLRTALRERKRMKSEGSKPE
ncbi:MAG: DedA family protein [Bacteroidia bacterium]